MYPPKGCASITYHRTTITYEFPDQADYDAFDYWVCHAEPTLIMPPNHLAEAEQNLNCAKLLDKADGPTYLLILACQSILAYLKDGG